MHIYQRTLFNFQHILFFQWFLNFMPYFFSLDIVLCYLELSVTPELMELFEMQAQYMSREIAIKYFLLSLHVNSYLLKTNICNNY